VFSWGIVFLWRFSEDRPLHTLERRSRLHGWKRYAGTCWFMMHAPDICAYNESLLQLVNFGANGRDGICVDHLVDFLALIDHHEVQVHRRTWLPGHVDHR
jgi:hypothetical protein